MTHTNKNWEETDEYKFILKLACATCYPDNFYDCPRAEKIKSFISSNFIPSKDLLEKINNIDVSGGGSGRRLKEQLLDWVKKQNNIWKKKNFTRG